jgi:hypothetical protein
MAQTPLAISTPDFNPIVQVIGVSVSSTPIQILAPGSGRILTFIAPDATGPAVYVCPLTIPPVIPGNGLGGGMILVTSTAWISLPAGSLGWSAIATAPTCLTIVVQ